jgi:hypothetical protein
MAQSLREDVTRAAFQARHKQFQRVDCDILFAHLDPLKRGRREADASRELRVRLRSPLLSEKIGELISEATAHPPTVLDRLSHIWDKGIGAFNVIRSEHHRSHSLSAGKRGEATG